MIRVTQKLLDHAEAAVLEDLTQYVQELNYFEAANCCLERLGRGLSSTLEGQLRSFFYGLWFLENALLHEAGTPKSLADTGSFCEAILRRCGIQPVSSKFSGLFNRVYASLSQASLVDGDPWLAMWQASIGERLSGGDDESGRSALATAQRAFKQGHIIDAASAFFLAESQTADLAERAQARLGRICCARLLGDATKARDLAFAAQAEFAAWPRGTDEFRWQQLVTEAQISGRCETLFVAWDRSSTLFKAEYALTAALLAHALPHAVPIKKIRRAATLKEIFAGDIGKDTREQHLARMLQAVEDCRDPRHNVGTRLKNLGTFFAKQRSHWQPEDQLIFCAAVSRWLYAQKQRRFLKHILEESSKLSLRLTDGKTHDALGLCQDLFRHLGELPASSAKRVLRFSSLAAQAGMLMLKGRAQNAGKSGAPRTPAEIEFSSNLLRLIIDEIGTFKGPAMKLGQLLIGLSYLPTELRLELQRALASTMRMPTATFEAVFAADFGKPPNEFFKKWQSTPIGVGSMGQVFKAELHDGTAVAVKITYPGLAKVVKADLRVFRFLLPIMRSFFPGIDMDTLLATLQSTCLDECDLRLEAAKHQFMYDTYAQRPGIIIPKLYNEYTTANVIVTEFIDGLKTFEFAPRATSEQKSHMIDTLVGVYVETIDKHSMAQFDPHGGNYLYCGDKVALLDFGSLATIPVASAQKFSRIWAGMVKGDVDEMVRILVREKILSARDVPEPMLLSFTARFLIDRYQKRLEIDSHDFSLMFDLYMRSSGKQGVTPDPYIALILLSSFMLNTMVFSLQYGTTAQSEAAAAAAATALDVTPLAS